MSTPGFKVGDLVVVAPLYARPGDHGVVYRITRILRVNIDAVPVHGGRTLRGKPHVFLPAPADTNTEAGAAGEPVRVETVPLLPTLWQATVVTIAGPGWNHPADQLWVVLKDKVDQVSVAKLGGIDGSRYYPRVPRAYISVIDPARLTYSPA